MSDVSEDTGGKVIPGRFKPGQSGNPSGRPRGSRNQTTLSLEALMAGQGEGVVNVVVQAALDGDLSAAKLVLDRIIPVRKDRPITLDLPQIASSHELTKALAAVVEAMASGEITPAEAATVATVLEGQRRVMELSEIEKRLEILEAKGELR